MIRVHDPKLSDVPMGVRVRVSAGNYTHEMQQRTYMPGSVRVPTDQPLGALAQMMLEPRGEDSLFQWGFFIGMLTGTEYIEGHVIAPRPRQMMDTETPLKTAVEAKL